MAKRFSISIDSRVERLADVSDFIENAACDCGLNAKQVYDVQMAVDEACSNVIEHAYSGKPSGTIAIVCEKRSNEFVITIRDNGKPFDPKRVARPKVNGRLDERTIGGLGLYFMDKMMDHVKFEFTHDGNLLTMVKRIKK
jgi:serine/threonine-protein kinase RsbW